MIYLDMRALLFSNMRPGTVLSIVLAFVTVRAEDYSIPESWKVRVFIVLRVVLS
jgi:hypothetical protein